MSDPHYRYGRTVEIDGLSVFADLDRYAPEIIATLDAGTYEARERWLAKETLGADDRVLEVGTAIGLVAMTAARIVGPEAVMTFEANPEILADARANFRRNNLRQITSHHAALKNRRAIGRQDETVSFYIDRHFWASRLNAFEGEQRIVGKIEVPVECLEDAIRSHRATALICDIEGGETELLAQADLAGIRKIIVETHYGWADERATDEMIAKLFADGFRIHLGLSGQHVTILRR